MNETTVAAAHDATGLERITLRVLRVPLTVPYKLAIGVVEAFDTILVELCDQSGRIGYGEATVLTGYTEETMEGARAAAAELAAELAGMSLGDAKRRAEGLTAERPFTATAFVTAIEMLEAHPLLQHAEPVSVPLLAIVNATDKDAIETELETHIAGGYRTLKVKVGFDVDPDLERLKFIQRRVAGRAAIRVDANQGFSRDEANRFVKGLDPEGIELLEQPCAAGDWDAAVAVVQNCPVPMMLDESIYGLADVERAARLKAAAYIKFKLMKAGSLDRLVAALERIRELGMAPVLGNGVACDIGCWMEACVAARMIDNAGEMNGFLKPRTGLFQQAIEVADGQMRLAPGGVPAVDSAKLAALTIESREFSGS